MRPTGKQSLTHRLCVRAEGTGIVDTEPTIEDIVAAAGRLNGAVMKTPCVFSETLSKIAGCRTFLKFENLQYTASFKERGALNKLLSRPRAELARGVCAMSAGNHAQGLAYHARRLGIPATIFMPMGTPLTKISRTRDHGADVQVVGANLSAALEAALEAARTGGMTFVHPYDDAEVIAGQGTLGLEMLDEVDDIDVIVVPIGGGGLISGIATGVKALRPGIEIIGVQSSTYPSMIRALAGDTAPCEDGMTIAEGIAVKTAGALTRKIVGAHVGDIVTVEESSIEEAIALLLSVEKTVVEGAGAAGLAAVLQYRDRFAGKKVVVPLTGGNIDLRVLASVAMRDLVRNGRLLRIEVPISDQPGALSLFASALGEAGANIVDIAHDRLALTLNPKGAMVDAVVEVQDARHGEAVVQILRDRHFGVRIKAI